MRGWAMSLHVQRGVRGGPGVLPEFLRGVRALPERLPGLQRGESLHRGVLVPEPVLGALARGPERLPEHGLAIGDPPEPLRHARRLARDRFWGRVSGG